MYIYIYIYIYIYNISHNHMHGDSKPTSEAGHMGVATLPSTPPRTHMGVASPDGTSPAPSSALAGFPDGVVIFWGNPLRVRDVTP